MENTSKNHDSLTPQRSLSYPGDIDECSRRLRHSGAEEYHKRFRGILSNVQNYFFPIYPSEGHGYHNETLLSNVRLHNADVRKRDEFSTFRINIDVPNDMEIRNVNFSNGTYTLGDEVKEFPARIKKAEQKLGDEELLNKVRRIFRFVLLILITQKGAGQSVKRLNMTNEAIITDYYAILRSLRFLRQNASKGKKSILVFYGGFVHTFTYSTVLRAVYSLEQNENVQRNNGSLAPIDVQDILTKLQDAGFYDSRITEEDHLLTQVLHHVSNIQEVLDNISVHRYDTEADLRSVYETVKRQYPDLENIHNELVSIVTSSQRDYSESTDIRNITMYLLTKIRNILGMVQIEAYANSWEDLGKEISMYITQQIDNKIKTVQDELGKSVSKRRR
jgi:hypothetical protein